MPTAPAALSFVELSDEAQALMAPAAQARAQLGGGVVIPLFANAGFLAFLRNLLCSMRRIQVHNWLAIALDNKTCPALMGSPGHGEQHACVHPYAGEITTSGVASYRSREFNRMVLQRPLWVRWLLQRGYTVLQCDLDIVWLRDPQPLLRSLHTVPHSRRHAILPHGNSIDIIFQSEGPYGKNGGFYYARPTNATLGLFRAWMHVLKDTFQSPKFEDQHALNTALGHRRAQVNVHQLEMEEFPNGRMWWTYPMTASKSKAYIVHANWAKKSKRSRLVRDRLWFTDSAGRCDPDFDPLEGGCSKLCAPVKHAPSNLAFPFDLHTCATLNKEDDYHIGKIVPTAEHALNLTMGRSGKYLRYSNQTVVERLRGSMWHPMAYAALPNCSRSLKRPGAVLVAELLFGAAQLNPPSTV